MARSIKPATFEQEVLTASVPVLVNFWAPWCGLCRLIEPVLGDLQAQWRGQVQLVSINADESLSLVSSYRLKTLPTVILFHEGTVLCRLEQFGDRQELQLAAAELQTAIEQVVKRYSYSL